jgi:hypothetical protein
MMRVGHCLGRQLIEFREMFGLEPKFVLFFLSESFAELFNFIPLDMVIHNF